MAGAMRLGQLTHVMESRLMAGDSLAPGTAPLFEALDTDLDRIAFVLDRLREGESNVALPWLAASTTEVAVSQADGGQRPTVQIADPGIRAPRDDIRWNVHAAIG